MTADEIRQRLSRVMEEYLRLDAQLREAENKHFRVCIFGSARLKPEDHTYQIVLKLARDLALEGVDIVTGGGPGLMEAANRGVRAARTRRSRSFGVTIDLPRVAEVANRHLDIKSSHKRFSSRLDEFMRLTHGVIVAPGGIGTMLELLYVWQLLQVGLIEERPLVLLDRERWGGLIEWMCDKMVACGYVGERDMDYIHMVSTPDEALEIMRDAHRRFQERVLAAPAGPGANAVAAEPGGAPRAQHPLRREPAG